MDTHQLFETLSFPESPVETIWDRCGDFPRFWLWFLDTEVVASLVRYARNYAFEADVSAWQWKPQVDHQPGHFVVPVVPEMSSHWRRWHLSASSWGLPLVWRRGSHDDSVPRTLRETADLVKLRAADSDLLGPSLQGQSLADYGISWPSDWRGVDMPDLPLCPGSAWAPLAVGLFSLLREQPLIDELFISGEWNEESGKWQLGLKGLLRKVDMGAWWGRTKFVVPRQSVNAVQEYLEEKRVVGEVQFLRDDRDLGVAVRPALELAGMEPDAAPENRSARVRWYLFRPTADSAREYYLDRLLPEIIAAQRETDWYREHADLFAERPRRMVSMVSQSPDLTLLSIKLFCPENCTLIYSRDADGRMEENFERIKRRVAHHNSLSETLATRLEHSVVRDETQVLTKISETVREMNRDSDGSRLLLDITPGRRSMALSLLAGLREGDQVLCWWTDTDPESRRVIPFSEVPLLWEVPADQALRPLIFGRAVPPGRETQ